MKTVQAFFALIGVQGIVRMALAGVRHGRLGRAVAPAELPLVRFSAASPKKKIPATFLAASDVMPADSSRTRRGMLLAGGFRAVKLRSAYPTLNEEFVRGPAP
jgi:hypothetical protein